MRGQLALDRALYAPLVTAALTEDVGFGDVTSQATVPLGRQGLARAIAKASGIVCGLALFAEAFRQVDESLEVTFDLPEGAAVESGDEVASVRGSLRSLLQAERVALNFLQHMSGVASLTGQFVRAIEGTGASILDTRKTLPGLRALQKYAVLVGGGQNHRLRLDSMVLIKDNHIKAAGGLRQAIEQARATVSPALRIEVETENLDQVREALAAQADWIMLDNMNPDLLREAVALVAGRARLEASGRVSLDTVRAIAETGVDFISVGALTHSARALDISLEVTEVD